MARILPQKKAKHKKQTKQAAGNKHAGKLKGAVNAPMLGKIAILLLWYLLHVNLAVSCRNDTELDEFRQHTLH
jgi:hypothetical protein